jgi:hypothetical protein
MHRRTLLTAALGVAACRTSSKPLDSVLPQQLAGGWSRGDVQSPAGDTPVIVTELRPANSAEATYTGPSSVRRRVFEMKSETSAFDLIQKWRQADGLAAYKGPYFLIANGRADATPTVITDLLRKLQQGIH